MAEAMQPLARCYLKGARISAFKVRLVADQIRGLAVSEALDLLTFSPRKAAGILCKVLQSAVANAENNRSLDPDRLRISVLEVSDGATLKRIKPRARGRADRFFKRSCHITLHLGAVE